MDMEGTARKVRRTHVDSNFGSLGHPDQVRCGHRCGQAQPMSWPVNGTSISSLFREVHAGIWQLQSCSLTITCCGTPRAKPQSFCHPQRVVRGACCGEDLCINLGFGACSPIFFNASYLVSCKSPASQCNLIPWQCTSVFQWQRLRPSQNGLQWDSCKLVSSPLIRPSPILSVRGSVAPQSQPARQTPVAV